MPQEKYDQFIKKLKINGNSPADKWKAYLEEFNRIMTEAKTWNTNGDNRLRRF